MLDVDGVGLVGASCRNATKKEAHLVVHAAWDYNRVKLGLGATTYS